ncbi:arylamine N-acetyltransferase [Mammaliicoccus lentus]|uniref:Arylamine N-acetyltransferase n=1 Tax=Mammaliicoccus lentus TaxID=42858 RepID=A0AAX3W5A5_MAMLE|nr:arylamine N-acetyltransferase [Mammaliicoccus lentus]WHI60560.1 arylamine N-acetyltransferase [Mammaliicoccus lentus]
MDIQKFEEYLKIDSKNYNQINLETLNHYITRFMYTVPFENISVQNQQPISVNIDDLYEKIVINYRGGFCYEMNTIFQFYLEQKGFSITCASATIHTPDDGWSNDGSHMTTIVQLDRPYIADVGFGDLPINALPVHYESENMTVTTVSGSYRAIYGENEEILVQKLQEDNSWRTSYKAKNISRPWSYFVEHLEFNEHNPESIFVQTLLITMAKTYGRVTMSQDQLTITKADGKEQSPVTPQNYKSILQKYFGLDVTIQTIENKV